MTEIVNKNGNIERRLNYQQKNAIKRYICLFSMDKESPLNIPMDLKFNITELTSKQSNK